MIFMTNFRRIIVLKKTMLGKKKKKSADCHIYFWTFLYSRVINSSRME